MLAVAKKKQIDPAFGQRLRELRKAKGWTLAQLGERADMMYQDVARLERSDREPVWSTVLRLATALEVTPDAFLSDPAAEAEDAPPVEEPGAGESAPRKRGKK